MIHEDNVWPICEAVYVNKVYRLGHHKYKSLQGSPEKDEMFYFY